MDSNIKDWMKMARRISKYLLNKEEGCRDQEVVKWGQERERHDRILRELEVPGFYAKKAAHQKAIEEKYTWDSFVSERKRRALRRRIGWWSCAASLLLLFCVGGGVWFYGGVSSSLPDQSPISIEAGGFKASLVLDNGQEVVLKEDLLITEKDGTIIHNGEDGEVSYTGATDSGIGVFNTLRVPRGGEYRVVLSDGTTVWINSDSELVFPTHFSGGKREVFLKGEAYFEIARDTGCPFYVNNEYMRIRATGTAFNVMAYSDEPDFQVTLVEGGVNIEKDDVVVSRLSRDFQFCLNKKDGSYRVKAVDRRCATGWRDGVFYFEQEPLDVIVRKLSRWYGVDIVFNEPGISGYQFSGEVKKYEDAGKVLDMLKLTNEISYIITSKNKITIFAID